MQGLAKGSLVHLSVALAGPPVLFVLGTDLTPIDIIGNVSIHSGPVDVWLGQVSHFLYTSVVAV